LWFLILVIFIIFVVFVIMRIAIVHDSFTQMGGAERVVDHLHELFPNAPVYTLVFDPKYKVKYLNWEIRTSPLQTLYLALGKLQYLLPFIPWAVNNFDFSGFDLVISSSSGFVKNIRVPKNTRHICYCHTPPRFLWIDKNYVKQEVPFILRPIVHYLLSKMRKWDLLGSKRVTQFIANSQEVQKRIESVYQRNCTVVYPGVDVGFWQPTISKKDYFLIAGRLQPHKNNEIIIQVFNELGKPLHVVGAGRQLEYLKSISRPNITFLGAVDDNTLRDEYSGALGYIYPQMEDFGLMPLEAAACGTATIALAKGGALETVLPGVTGELFESANKKQIKQIILNWKPEQYTQENLRVQAEKFSKKKFIESISRFCKL
jgi:glycosyltransferase involved in cell wall biosynthesis